MGDVSKGEGRTVLFVSHNITAVKELCGTGILLKNGLIDYHGNIMETALQYQKSNSSTTEYVFDGIPENVIGNENITLLEFTVKPVKGKIIDIESGIHVKLIFENNVPHINLDATFELKTFEELVVFHVGKALNDNNDSKIGKYQVEFEIPSGMLNAGSYYFKLLFGKNQTVLLFGVDNFVSFEVENVKAGSKMHVYPGITRPIFDYNVLKP